MQIKLKSLRAVRINKLRISPEYNEINMRWWYGQKLNCACQRWRMSRFWQSTWVHISYVTSFIQWLESRLCYNVTWHVYVLPKPVDIRFLSRSSSSIPLRVLVINALSYVPQFICKHSEPLSNCTLGDVLINNDSLASCSHMFIFPHEHIEQEVFQFGLSTSSQLSGSNEKSRFQTELDRYIRWQAEFVLTSLRHSARKCIEGEYFYVLCWSFRYVFNVYKKLYIIQ